MPAAWRTVRWCSVRGIAKLRKRANRNCSSSKNAGRGHPLCQWKVGGLGNRKSDNLIITTKGHGCPLTNLIPFPDNEIPEARRGAFPSNVMCSKHAHGWMTQSSALSEFAVERSRKQKEVLHCSHKSFLHVICCGVLDLSILTGQPPSTVLVCQVDTGQYVTGMPSKSPGYQSGKR